MLGVVLAIPSSLRSAPTRPDDGPLQVEPSTKLCGLSLALRLVLGLQKEGASRVLLVIRSGDRPLFEQIRADRRLRIEVTSVEVADSDTPLGALREHVDEPFVLCAHDLVLDPAVLRALVRAPEPGRLGLAAGRKGVPLGHSPPLRGKPLLLERLAELEASTVDAPAPGPDQAPPVDDGARDAGSPRAAGAAGVGQLVTRGELELLDVGQAWAADARTAAGRKEAVFQLFEACRKSVDGVVSRYLNRHVSLFLSKRLVDTPVSPNAMTVMTFLVGLAGAIVAARGGYLPTLVGAALMQLNSILDGVDGELARVRLQQSKLGQWLDTIGDDSTNLFFYVGLALGARSLAWGATVASTAGWVVAATTVLAAALYYTELLGVGSGDLNALSWSFDEQATPSWRSKLLHWGHYLLKQDCFIFLFLLFALGGVLHYALTIFATGGIITVIAAASRRLVTRRHRPESAAR